MEKKTARRWLRRNRTRMIMNGATDKDKRQVKLCFESLGFKVKTKSDKNKGFSRKTTAVGACISNFKDLAYTKV